VLKSFRVGAKLFIGTFGISRVDDLSLGQS
jgi:hypothetical protein